MIIHKSCYGNYMLDVCTGHHECKDYGCFSETSIRHGKCDCKYKGSCHLVRQECQVMIRNSSNSSYHTVEQCDIYKILAKMSKTNAEMGIVGGYAPGDYQCICYRCESVFNGDKRAVECKQCASGDSSS